MRAALIMVMLSLSFCNQALFAADASSNTKVQGNQGYVYGKPLTADSSAAAANASNDPGPIVDIYNVIEKLDTWIRRNLW